MRSRFSLPLALAATIFTAQPVFAQNINELFRKGNAAREAGNFSTSAQIFRTIISIEPNNAGAYVGLGVALGDQGNLAEAITNYRTAES
jgi:Flp pilus assembly protein TadD